MTGPEHYRVAEELAASVTDVDVPVEHGMATIALAQVHATLAAAAATIDVVTIEAQAVMPGPVQKSWVEAVR